ncbi:hypothetical protein N836_29905 [Leptolyngbya sp. Heron Island J]|uniref:hypothetical protein n=1 Tax=Leptolyngbya sp. Heron Island J TaxID=1385935 RepID=UPI0003B980E3|nr:hypothetical protein [Leptolyngbya sp. Heron Island J]ESA38918.1 hypothetical protein N836_29905 [Leptolyngbya sp. Heron Island J]
MLLQKQATSTSPCWKMTLASVVAIATLWQPAAGLAQTNQSDVTGPNLSDVTGPNLSDVTGPNQSDNTGIDGEQTFRNSNGDFVSLSEFFEDFFDTYGEELGIDPNASLADKLRQAVRGCSAESTGGTRRFARNPGDSAPPVSLACEEFNRLVQSARQSLDEYPQSRPQANTVEQRLW